MKSDSIITSRLQLREIEECDTDLIVNWRSDPEVYQYFCSPHMITRQEHLQWFHERYMKNPNHISYIATETVSNNSIGVFGISRESELADSVEVSYLLDKSAQGKGYAGEAVLGMLEFAKNQWYSTKAVAEIHKDNHASLKMIQRLSFVEDAMHEDFRIYKRVL